MALRFPKPLNLAAIDAGSNAFRLIIARARSLNEWETIESVREPIRLGHCAFTTGKFDRKTLREAVSAFRLFRRIMDHHGVTDYRAVTTSAAREAVNGHVLIRRVNQEARINLEVISGEEEARLVRVAVLRAMRGLESPRFILDLGGGSLELNEFRQGVLQKSVGLPLGTVRLMEAYGAHGIIHEHVFNELRMHVGSVLRSAVAQRPRFAAGLAVACGGNAETLGVLAAGPKIGGLGTLNPRLLHARLWQILRLDVEARMRSFLVRRDRAEVMGVAAIVLLCVANWLRLRTMITPRVGVREGLLYELAAAQMNPGEPEPEYRQIGQLMKAGTDAFAHKMRCDMRHAEQVRMLALCLFDGLWPYHRMGFEQRSILEAAATLHDSGHVINRKGHHRHGEYMIRYAKLPDLPGWRKTMIACLVRYHNGKSEPHLAHKLFASLSREHRKITRVLAGILRLAECLGSDHGQAIAGLTLEGGPDDIRIHVELRDGSRLNLSGIGRKARLLERELNLQLSFQRVLVVEKVRVA